MSISISRELVEREQNLNPPSCYLYNDLFGSTWLASHVRLVELEPISDRLSSLSLLAYILSRQLDAPRSLDWLWRSYLVASDGNELKRLIEHAVSDILEGAAENHKNANECLSEALEALDADHATEIYAVSSNPELAMSVDAYLCGPTYQVCWWSAGNFYFLEVHNES